MQNTLTDEQRNSGKQKTRQERKDEHRNKCAYGAPLFVWRDTNSAKWTIAHGNCHHWDCPRCGKDLARQHYGRMLHGIQEASVDAWCLLTLTAPGGETTVQEAEDSLLLWSNRLLTAIRANAKRRGIPWFYVAVTERQKRGHPHLHIIISWQPKDSVLVDAFEYTGDAWTDASGKTRRGKRLKKDRDGNQVKTIRSKWLHKRIVKAGFGPVWDLSPIRNRDAATRYIAKYLFKSVVFETWPSGWKRIRYSQSWPRLDKASDTEARVLLTTSDLVDFLKWNDTIHDSDDVSLDERVQYAKQIASEQAFDVGHKDRPF